MEAYPLTSFFFSVYGISSSGTGVDCEFQSVSGLSVEIGIEEYAEGGENRFKHQLPMRPKYPNLVLKKGLVTNSSLIDWCRKATEKFEFETKDLTIRLKGATHSVSWNIVGAYPVKWGVSEFNAEENKLAIENVELKYKYFTVSKEKN